MSTVTENAKKTRRSAFTEKCQRLAGPRSLKMAKTRQSAVTENAKTRRSAVTENAKNSQDRGHSRMSKTCRSAVTEIFQKTSKFTLTKNEKNALVSIYTKIAKTSQVRSHGKCQKLAALRSQKMPKIRRSAVMEICKKLPGSRSQKI